MYDYEAANPGDMSFKAGEVMELSEVSTCRSPAGFIATLTGRVCTYRSRTVGWSERGLDLRAFANHSQRRCSSRGLSGDSGAGDVIYRTTGPRSRRPSPTRAVAELAHGGVLQNSCKLKGEKTQTLEYPSARMRVFICWDLWSTRAGVSS